MYYHFVLNYVKFSPRPISQGEGVHWELCTGLSIISAHESSERVELISDKVNSTLKMSQDRTLKHLIKSARSILTARQEYLKFLDPLYLSTMFLRVTTGIGVLHTS